MPRSVFLNCFHSFVFVSSFLLFFNHYSFSPAHSQKIKDIKISIPTWLPPKVKIPENYKTYSIGYCTDSVPLDVEFIFPVLKFQRENADLKLRVCMGPVTFRRNLEVIANQVFNYKYYVHSNHGFELYNAKGSLIGKSFKSRLTWSSNTYGSEKDLYKNEDMVGTEDAHKIVISSLIEMLTKDVVYSKYPFEVILKEIEFDNPEIHALNKSVLATIPKLEALNVNNEMGSDTLIDKAISDLAHFISKVHFKEKMGVYGKITGNAAIENLVILCLATGKLEMAYQHSKKFNKENSGFLAHKMTGKTHAQYPFSYLWVNNNSSQAMVKQTYKVNLAQLTEDYYGRSINPHKNSHIKYKTLIGLSLGQRPMSFHPADVFYEDKKLNMGSNLPLYLTFYIQAQAKSKLVMNMSFDVVASKSLGGAWVVSAGYHFKNRRFSFIPLFGLGYGRFTTELEKYKLGNRISFVDKQVFVGPSASNAGRGAGSDISLDISSGFFLLKPEAQVQYHIKKISIIGSLAYNVAFGGKGEIKLSGEGYTNMDDYQNSRQGPIALSVKKGNIRDYLKDASGNPIERTPVKPSGLSWTIGLAYTF